MSSACENRAPQDGHDHSRAPPLESPPFGPSSNARSSNAIRVGVPEPAGDGLPDAHPPAPPGLRRTATTRSVASSRTPGTAAKGVATLRRKRKKGLRWARRPVVKRGQKRRYKTSQPVFSTARRNPDRDRPFRLGSFSQKRREHDRQVPSGHEDAPALRQRRLRARDVLERVVGDYVVDRLGFVRELFRAPRPEVAADPPRLCEPPGDARVLREDVDPHEQRDLEGLREADAAAADRAAEVEERLPAKEVPDGIVEVQVEERDLRLVVVGS